MRKDTVIIHKITSSTGSRESSSVELVAHTETGETYLRIEKSFYETYPITDYDKVMKLHEDLNRGGGRRAYKLKDLTK